MCVNSLGDGDELSRYLLHLDFIGIEYLIWCNVQPINSKLASDGDFVSSYPNVPHCFNNVADKGLACGICQWEWVIVGQKIYQKISSAISVLAVDLAVVKNSVEAAVE
jgi:hypothetical protein